MSDEEKAIRQWLADIYDLCDFLQHHKGHHAYKSSIPERFNYLLEDGSLSGVAMYQSGWGWRLRKGWKIVWAYLVAEYLIVPIGAPFLI